LFILALSMNLMSANVETGNISGVVISETGVPLVGATVMVVGTSNGAMTDSFGTYTIINLAAGTYSLHARMLGMRGFTVEGVIVTADHVTIQDFYMSYYPMNSYPGSHILIRI
jgi:hypothetical protein